MRFPQSKLDDVLKRVFFRLGLFIGHHPGYFIIVPVLLTALFATGFQQLNYNYDPEYLLSPSTGAAKDERKIQETYFPVDYENFQATRMSRIGKFGRLIVTQNPLGSILRTEFWNDLIDIEEAVYNISIEHEGISYQYEDICAKWNGYCKYNEILGIAQMMPEVESGSFNLSTPLTFDPVTFQSYILPAWFGGIVADDIGRVRSIEAVSLTYFLDLSEEWQLLVGDQWEKKFLSTIDEVAKTKPKISIAKYISSTQALEMEASKNSITPNLVINIIAMVIFCVLASSMADSVKSKPLIGFLGILSASLATISGFGLVCYAKVDFIALCLAAPFLLFGIGIDDTFVMLSAWRRSERYLNLPERLGHTFSDAAVSITVTSLTDFLSFMAGVITPFPCVRIFCLYTGTAVAFIYLWQLTFFGGCLAIAGFAEQQNRHGLICVKVQPKSLSTNRGWFYRLFCAGGKNPVDPYNPQDNGEHAAMVWLRDNLGYALGLKWVKSLVLIVFTAYIVVSIWGITRLKEGLEKRNTVNYDSYSVAYYDAEDKYYLDYRYIINVVVSGDIYYSDPKTQDKLEKMMKVFENSTFIAEDMSTSWLRDFLGFIERNKQYEDIGLRLETEAEFVHSLDTIYLSDPSSALTLDVRFNEQRDRIVAARFILQGFDVKNANEETDMVLKLREIASQFSDENIQVSVFHPYFIYIDQFLEILPQTVQSILVTSGFMMIVSFVLIPNPICSLWVAFSILSIEAGVVGYMTWWGINLDGIALINLIMCIGFSVDFSAHICYHYMSEENKSSEERIRSSLYALGLPIVQGALSTILGVLGLAFAPCYAYVTFFKMIFLVIFLGAMHGLILLPVLLSLFGPGSCTSGSSSKNRDDEMVTCNKLTPTLSMAPVTVYGTREDKCCVVRRITHQANSPMQKHRVSDIAGIENIGYDGRNNDTKPYINNKMINPTDPRLTPVPETDEAYDSIMHVLHVARAQKPNAAYRNQQRLVRTDAQRPADAHAQRLDRSFVDGQRFEREEKMAPTCAVPNRVVTVVGGETRPVDKLPDINHKRLIRSVSHRPDQDLKNKFDTSQKQTLRKYHSFPYKVFVDDTGYSSDDSI